MFARRIVVGLGLGTFVMAAATLVGTADDKPAGLGKKLSILLDERVVTAKRGVEANQAAYEAGAITVDQVIQSHKDLAIARLAVAKTPAERLAALREQYEGLLGTEEIIAKLYRNGSRGGEANQMAMISVARQTAEIQMLEEELRSATTK